MCGWLSERWRTQRGCRTFLPASEVVLAPDLSISDSCSNTSLNTRKKTCQCLTVDRSDQNSLMQTHNVLDTTVEKHKALGLLILDCIFVLNMEARSNHEWTQCNAKSEVMCLIGSPETRNSLVHVEEDVSAAVAVSLDSCFLRARHIQVVVGQP